MTHPKQYTVPVPDPHPGALIQPMPGVRIWRNAANEFLVVETHYTADPNRRGNWRHKASPKYGGLKSWRWRKEQEIEWDAMAGKLVFEQWQDHTHIVDSFEPPEHWPRWLLFDPGWTNPSSILWVAVDTDSAPNDYGFLPIHVYREIYETRRSTFDLAQMCESGSWIWTPEGERVRERVECIIVDPGAKQEHQSAASPENVDEGAGTVFDQFKDEIQQAGWAVSVKTGNNHKQEAIVELIQRLGNFWVDHEGIPLHDDNDNYRQPSEEELLDGAYLFTPTIFVHTSCPETAREMKIYRWRDWSSAEVRERRNDPESPVDKDDHSVTNLIRFTNELRRLRGGAHPDDEEGMLDLEHFESRFDRQAPRPADEIQEEYHRQAAGRFRRKRTGQDDEEDEPWRG